MRRPRRERTVLKLDTGDVYRRAAVGIAVGLNRMIAILAVLGLLTGPYKLGCVAALILSLAVSKLGLWRLNQPVRTFRLPAGTTRTR